MTRWKLTYMTRDGKWHEEMLRTKSRETSEPHVARIKNGETKAVRAYVIPVRAMNKKEEAA